MRSKDRVTGDELPVRHAFARDLEHRLTRVEADDLAAQMLRQPARPAGDVQGANGGELGDCPLELPAFLVPSRPVPVDEQAGAVDPVVVLPGAPVVVRLHAPRVRA
jgi:hypothetical protein